jgi:hypothetical protein
MTSMTIHRLRNISICQERASLPTGDRCACVAPVTVGHRSLGRVTAAPPPRHGSASSINCTRVTALLVLCPRHDPHSDRESRANAMYIKYSDMIGDRYVTDERDMIDEESVTLSEMI